MDRAGKSDRDGEAAGAVFERCNGRGRLVMMCGDGALLVFVDGKRDS